MTCNGEDLIRKAIQSVEPYVDEIIVYDTGSSDLTMGVLQSLAFHTHGKVRVYQEWIDELPNEEKQARLTYVLNKMIAMSSGDWILRVDDDEVFPKETMEEIQMVDNIVPVYSIPFLHYEEGHFVDPAAHKKDSFYVARLFRNLPSVQWVNPFLIPEKHSGAVIAVNGMKISSRGNQIQYCRKLSNPFLHLGELRSEGRRHKYDFHEKGHCELPLGIYADYVS